MHRASLVVVLAALLPWGGATAQADLYDEGSVREIHLTFTRADWRQALDSLYLVGEHGRLLGDVMIDGTLLRDVGVRFKGYSSYSPGRAKNPFNIDLNEVVQGQHYQGHKKLKLANVSYDPSFLRETLSYAIARCYMPASRANYADVYVNGEYVGLYTNVEDVGKDFVQRHFGSNDNPFFKGAPPTVDLTGENANLSDSPGGDSTAYYGRYSMQSEHGWARLLNLIDVLNHAPEAVDSVLDVDRALWMHAFNYALINFDSYVGYAQNYYLYEDDHRRWNPIVWDLNMSFASFRLTDASLFWNGFSIPQAITMDPLMHHNSISVLPRPLMRNLFQSPMHRRMYLAHLRTIVEEWFTSQLYRAHAEDLRTLISAHVLADTNKFFSHQAFLDNLDGTVQDLVAYVGVAELMDQRAAWLANYPGYAGAPVIGAPQHAPQDITVGGTMTITVPISGADTAFVAYRHRSSGPFQRLPLHDDGAHDDGAAGDGVFGTLVTTASGLLQFYIYAENATAGRFSPERAEYVIHQVENRILPGQLVINECMASNAGVVLNEAGEAADWVELYNPSPWPVSTVGLHLSDDPLDVRKWALPLHTLPPGGYLTLWLDERTELGDHHADFKLDADGGSLLLAYDDSTVIDRVDLARAYPIYSHGRLPNGTGEFRLLPPTFGTYNQLRPGSNVDQLVQLWPNPATSEVQVIVQLQDRFTMQVFMADGRAMTGMIERMDNALIRLDTRTFPPGHFILLVRSDDQVFHQPFIITE